MHVRRGNAPFPGSKFVTADQVQTCTLREQKKSSAMNPQSQTFTDPRLNAQPRMSFGACPYGQGFLAPTPTPVLHYHVACPGIMNHVVARTNGMPCPMHEIASFQQVFEQQRLAPFYSVSQAGTYGGTALPQAPVMPYHIVANANGVPVCAHTPNVPSCYPTLPMPVFVTTHVASYYQAPPMSMAPAVILTPQGSPYHEPLTSPISAQQICPRMMQNMAPPSIPPSPPMSPYPMALTPPMHELQNFPEMQNMEGRHAAAYQRPPLPVREQQRVPTNYGFTRNDPDPPFNFRGGMNGSAATHGGHPSPPPSYSHCLAMGKANMGPAPAPPYRSPPMREQPNVPNSPFNFHLGTNFPAATFGGPPALQPPLFHFPGVGNANMGPRTTSPHQMRGPTTSQTSSMCEQQRVPPSLLHFPGMGNMNMGPTPTFLHQMHGPQTAASEQQRLPPSLRQQHCDLFNVPGRKGFTNARSREASSFPASRKGHPRVTMP